MAQVSSVGSDIDRALGIYSMIATKGPDETLFVVTIPGAPPSKARHRHGQGRTFKTAKDIANESHTAGHLAAVVPEPFTGNVAIGCMFYRPNRQRIDVDNMLKHVCDAAKGILWIDDSQATAVFGVVELDPDEPRTVVVIGRHSSTLERGTDAVYPCAVCGKPIQRDSKKFVKTCSKSCAVRARGGKPLEAEFQCAHCGKPFRRTTSYQTMCSAECRAASFSGKRRAARRYVDCIDCGKQLTHGREGSRCRDCWRASVRSDRQ
jgi:Holliday junction resolvase RusA-like endonuclease